MTPAGEMWAGFSQLLFGFAAASAVARVFLEVFVASTPHEARMFTAVRIGVTVLLAIYCELRAHRKPSP